MKTYSWNIDITLKNSGVLMPCVYEGVECTSDDVFTRIFTNKQPDEIIGLGCNNGKSNAFICVSEIAAVDIYQKY